MTATRRKMPPTRWRPTRWPRDVAAWPRRAAPGAFILEPGATGLPRPVSTSKAKSPHRRLRPGGDGVGAQMPCMLDDEQRSVAASAGKISMAPRRQGRGLWSYAPTCCGRLCESVPSSTLTVRRLYVTKDGSPTRRPASPYGTSTPRLKHVAASCGKGRSHLVVGGWPCSRQGASRCSRRAGMPSRPCLHSGQATCTSLVCCESWRGHGCALGFMAATFQRKQFPRRCAASSRDKLFALPGSPLRCDRKRCGPPVPRRPDHNKDALARPWFTERRNHHG